MPFEIKPIDPSKMTWEVRSDGEIIRPRLLEINSPYGNLKLGLRPEGFHGWAFKPGKGGAMTFPWTKTPTGEILIGLVHEYRPNMGPGKVWCPLGGFIDGEEAPEEAARREAIEEGGLDSLGSKKLPGVQINADRLYYIMEEGDDWGMKAYGFQIPFESLESAGEEMWRAKKNVISHKKESELFFLPWKKAILVSADALALAGIARLLREIY